MYSENSISQKLVLLVSVLTSTFLMFIYLNSKTFHLDFILIGVFQEMFTIPSVLIQPVIMYIAFRKFIKMKFKIHSFVFVAIIISSITFILTWGSLIIDRLPTVF